MIAMMLLTALSMAFGWRIRGQFGHEVGAALPGALGAMAVALLAARPDWHRRIHYFALLGGLGWSFGGSISYMKVIGYCHSSDSATVLYGFAGVFLIGFLWAGLGGAGTSLAAVLDESRLRDVVRAALVVCMVWFAEDIVVDLLRGAGVRIGGWFDADWTGATTALVTGGVLLWRRRTDFGAALVLHLAAGWWLVFGLLVPVFGLHLNPPRGDNWAGVIGLFLGWLAFTIHMGLPQARTASVWCGVLGATGFCLGQALKLVGIATGATWGWHATMEWFHGLFFGIALAVAMAPLLRGAAVPWSFGPLWLEVGAAVFVAWIIPYLNFRRTPPIWLRHVKTLPASFYGLNLSSNFLPSRGWFGWMELGFVAVGAVLAWLLVRHARESLALLPDSWRGRGQLLYLTPLWIMYAISTVHEAAMLEPMVLVMQLGVGVTGAGCCWLLLASPLVESAPALGWPRRMLPVAVACLVAATLGGWAVKRALNGDKFAGYFYMDHIRFGPNNTNDKR